MENNNLIKVYSSIARAHNFLNRSIEKINPNIVLNIFNASSPKLLGIKNTKAISNDFLELLNNLGYFLHTIDKASDRGRAIDIELKNPLTGRPMTGSSSGTAINVLYGINNIGIGTDGGGSVLAPSISLNLYSVLYKGIGICGNIKKKSTDNIEFTPGVGVISQYFDDITIITERLVKDYKERNLNEKELYKSVKLKAIKDTKILLLNQIDSDIKEILKSHKINFSEENIELADNREELINLSSDLTKKYDAVIYLEKMIDIEGFGDSVFGTMGHTATEIQNKANKKIIKVINMINGSAITLPYNEISTGLIIFGGEGIETLETILSLGKILDKERRTPLFRKYFLDYSLQEIENRWF